MALIASAPVRAAEGAAAAQHFVQHRTEREDVGAMIRRQPPDLLRRHVADRAEHDARLSRRRRCGELRETVERGLALDQFREAEIENLDVAVARDEHVLRLRVAMDDAAIVRGRQAACDLPGVVDCLTRGQRAPALQPRAQRRALEQFRDDVGRPFKTPMS
jgi:hypothetical protein